MLPFKIDIRPGSPVYEQIIFAAHKALVAGQLKPGDPFPSVRTISRELQINPNTVQRVVSHLTKEGILEVYSGRGTFISADYKPSAEARKVLLKDKIEALVVEARKLSIDQETLIQEIDKTWKRI